MWVMKNWPAVGVRAGIPHVQAVDLMFVLIVFHLIFEPVNPGRRDRLLFRLVPQA
jgi:hypothetical protein